MSDISRTIIIAAIAGIATGLAFGFGETVGRAQLMQSTVVRTGSPFFPDGKNYFGECARINIHNPEPMVEACATER